MDSYPEDNPAFPGDTRPNLRPVDLRAIGGATNDFTIEGSIDNASTFDAATGTNTPHRV